MGAPTDRFSSRAFNLNGKRGSTPIDITGWRCGNWLVLERAGWVETGEKKRIRTPTWLCECQCGSGVRKVLVGASLRQGHDLGTHMGCGKGNNCGKRRSRIVPYWNLWNSLLRNAAKHPIAVTISFADFVAFTTETKCFYCWSPVVWEPCYGIGRGSGYNLDRKDNEVGYAPNNLVVCCRRCNRGKSNHFTFDEWYRMTECFRRDGAESKMKVVA